MLFFSFFAPLNLYFPKVACYITGNENPNSLKNDRKTIHEKFKQFLNNWQ